MTKRILLLGAGIRHPQLIPFFYGRMDTDSNADGIVDGFTHAHWHEVSVLSLDGGQKFQLAVVTDADAGVRAYPTSLIVILPNTTYTLSIDAALIRSGAETIQVFIRWYTVADAFISESAGPEVNPGTTYSRQALTATSPATAAKARVDALVLAKAIGATGVAHFRNAVFRRRFDGRG